MLNTSILVTNIDDSEEPDFQGLHTNSTIVERNGTRIGIIGVILSTTNVSIEIFFEEDNADLQLDSSFNLWIF